MNIVHALWKPPCIRFGRQALLCNILFFHFHIFLYIFFPSLVQSMIFFINWLTHSCLTTCANPTKELWFTHLTTLQFMHFTVLGTKLLSWNSWDIWFVCFTFLGHMYLSGNYLTMYSTTNVQPVLLIIIFSYQMPARLVMVSHPFLPKCYL